ncbi:MAG: hypothetical protein PHE18_03580 [Candidatus Omnitrophica bacterium]|nr:hypothetical protein [Candidatus Omnitrophota bacterium]MDD5552938.1 hypothetical protein [Candidatus Omnitrophota bacterium]
MDRQLNWTSAAKQYIEKTVTENFPHEAHRWPIIHHFNAECLEWNKTHWIIILRDKTSGIPHIGAIKPLDEPDAPKLRPTKDSLFLWYKYIIKQYNIRIQDAFFIIPLVDEPGKVEEEYKKWSQEDQELWRYQVEFNISNHMKFLGILDFNIPGGYDFLKENLKVFFNDNKDYEKNVFIMCRFDKTDNKLKECTDKMKEILSNDFGLNGLLAEDKMYLGDRSFWNNVCVYMIGCSRGIALLENFKSDEFNPNIAVEYGFMRALDKKVLILKENKFQNIIRADMLGIYYEPFDYYNLNETLKFALKSWLTK